MSPHHTDFSVVSSHTTNLSFGERPVNFPVSTASAPVSVKTPSPLTMDSSTSSAGVRFQYASSMFLIPRSATVASFAFKPNSFMFAISLTAKKGKIYQKDQLLALQTVWIIFVNVYRFPFG